MNLKPLFCVVLGTLLCSAGQLHAQGQEYESALKRMRLKEYSIATKSDTIYFLVTEPDKKKKTIILCQGSGPVPLVVNLQQGLCSPFPFQLDSSTRKEFNVVIISKPGVKRFASERDLGPESVKQGLMLQLDSMNRPPKKYMANNRIEKLGGDCIEVIRYLRKQNWVDKDNIYLLGHSQGAHIAAYVACKDPNEIKGLIYCQANAYGVYAGYLSSLLSDQTSVTGDISSKMDSLYQLHDALLNNNNGASTYDLYYGGWSSLEEPPAIDYLLKINAPILLVNGLASAGELDNKNIPLDFVRHHKHNLSTRFYPGYDHNFFKKVVDEKGNAKEPEFHWDDVFDDIKAWIRGVPVNGAEPGLEKIKADLSGRTVSAPNEANDNLIYWGFDDPKEIKNIKVLNKAQTNNGLKITIDISLESTGSTKWHIRAKMVYALMHDGWHYKNLSATKIEQIKS